MFTHLEEERRVLEEDSYVDDILTSHNDPKKLEKCTKNVEEILKAGGFFSQAMGPVRAKWETEDRRTWN